MKIMSVAEMQMVVIRKVSEVKDENALQKIISHLESLSGKNIDPNEDPYLKHAFKFINERRELFKRLA